LLNSKADDRDKMREKKVDELLKNKEEILKKKDDDDKEIERMK
jgi:hypothetical protein